MGGGLHFQQGKGWDPPPKLDDGLSLCCYPAVQVGLNNSTHHSLQSVCSLYLFNGKLTSVLIADH